MAEKAGICTEENVAIGEDDPHTYKGLVTMAHELGHSLGSDHDSCEGAKDCPARYGNLMTNIDKGMRNKSRLSECSQRQIRTLVRRLEPSCINVSTVANYTNEGYPGENITHDDFCRLMHPETENIQASTEDAQECSINCCWNETLGIGNRGSSSSSEMELIESQQTTTEQSDEYSYDEEVTFCGKHSMLDGMPCSENKTCNRGICDTHNWSSIKWDNGTFRTFANIS
ncbi:zinc metalloproteinase-disintegrin-like brevilysin H2b isoform X1 [Dermacentor silvarum]|uniref:zinc metalloproteinase-disintegrin-like brevilysin H2b isoform X1 n=1 Tax=Dermacentor silvarum TaxID=543639 RepID=UPI0021009566|nr:zinc metalloproteinase-disintegrin-like brevilysin H2b isoform X1 [Dermacentor silvarum]